MTNDPTNATPPKTVKVDYQPSAKGPESAPPPSEPPVKPSLLDRLATQRGLTFLGIFTALVLVLAIVFAVLYFQNRQKPKSAFPNLTAFTPPPSLSDLAVKYPKYADILNDPALGSVYKDFLIEYEEKGTDGAIEMAKARGMINKKGEIMVTLVFNSPVSQDAQDKLKELGVIINAVSGSQIDIGIPLELVEKQMQSDDPAAIFKDLTELQDIKQVKFPVLFSPNDSALAPSLKLRQQLQMESLPGMNAPAWHKAGFTGKGMKIGVLDFGFDKYKDELGKEIPDASMFTVQSFIAGTAVDQTGIEHGTAVSEIIHAIAPDAQIFGAAYASDTEFYEAIDWLVSQGVTVINHSGGGSFGPRDGSGPDADKLTQVMDDNILWVNSAGNEGDVHWRGPFTDTDQDGIHEFDSNGNIGIGFIPYGDTCILVEWDDWDTATEDLDIAIVDQEGNVIVDSADIQDGENDPAEAIQYLFPDDGPYFLVIQADRVTRPVMIDVFFESAEIDPNYMVAAGSIASPGDTEAVLTVGAYNWKSQEITYYSSQGPTTDGRLKPDISGPSETYSAAYLGEFAGTSNSSPQVAGAAILIRQAFPNMSAYEVKDLLIRMAKDAGPSGPDTAYGSGLLWMGKPPVAGEPQPTLEAPFATPEPIYVTPSPVETTEEDDSDTWFILIGGGCCFTLLFVMGLVLIVVLLTRRKKTHVPAYYQAPRPPQPAYRQAPPSRPNQCKFCHLPLQPGARFCPHCGQKQ